jgi:membrane protease YdiL (CAAX protease family)
LHPSGDAIGPAPSMRLSEPNAARTACHLDIEHLTRGFSGRQRRRRSAGTGWTSHADSTTFGTDGGMHMPADRRATKSAHGEQISLGPMIALHLLPGALMILFLYLGALLARRAGLFVSLPVMFAFAGPLGILVQLGFLYYQGVRLNGKLSLQGVVRYRGRPVRWKTLALALPLFAWIALVWYVLKPPINAFFVSRFFSWVPAHFFEQHFVSNLDQYAPNTLKAIGVLFTLSISFGGAVEELYFRGYLLPRMESLRGWAPIVNTVLFSLYHFWSPWENLVRLLGLSPWIYAVWRTRSIYLSLTIHFVINAISGLSLLGLILQQV